MNKFSRDCLRQVPTVNGDGAMVTKDCLLNLLDLCDHYGAALQRIKSQDIYHDGCMSLSEIVACARDAPKHTYSGEARMSEAKWLCPSCKAINAGFGLKCHNCGKWRV